MDYPVTTILVVVISVLILASTFTLSIRGQLLLFFAYIPFVDTLKRMVFLDAGASSTNMYIVLVTQDILLIALLIKVFLGITNQQNRIRIRTVDIAVLLFAVISIISALITPVVPLSGRITAIGLRVWPMITYPLAAIYLTDDDSIKRFVKLILVVGVFVALYGIQQFFFGLLPFEELWYEQANSSSDVAHLQYYAGLGVFRTFGTLDSHSSYGLLLGMSLVFAWAWKRKLGIAMWLILSLVLAFGLVLSFTRFTWFMPVLASFFIFLFSYNKIRPFFSLANLRKASLLLLAITGLFGVFYLAMSSLYGVQLVSASSNSYLRRAFGTNTLEARLKVGNLLGPDAKLSLFGNGLAGSEYFARKFDFVSTDVNYHNIFVDMVDSMGIVGLVIFMLLLYLLIRAGIKSISSQTNPQTRTILIALFGLFLALVTVGHFNGAVFYFGRAIPAYFWAICGILAHFEKSATDTASAMRASENYGM